MRQHRRLPSRRIAAHPGRVLAHSRLVGPVHLPLLGLGPPDERRIVFLQPLLYLLRGLLQGSLGRALRREPPAPQVLAHRADGQRQTELDLDGLLHRLTAPQRIRQSEGRGRPAEHPLA